jgi:hypothetical protein
MEAISGEAEAPAEKAESMYQTEPEKSGKVIPLFGKNDPIPTHPTKKGRQ